MSLYDSKYWDKIPSRVAKSIGSPCDNLYLLFKSISGILWLSPASRFSRVIFIMHVPTGRGVGIQNRSLDSLCDREIHTRSGLECRHID